MKWRILSDYAAISDCGRYTVAVVNIPINGELTRTYEASLNPIKRGAEYTFLGQQLATRLSTAKEAQEICEAHARAQDSAGAAA